ncbi:MAG: tail fiber domain-containing protein [Micavibrio sp.]
MTQRWGESGNVFFTLFGAVALVGVVGAATSTLMRGPVGTVVSLNQRAKADSQMQIAMKLAMLEAQQRTTPSFPDCDGDTLIEPVAPGAALPGLTGGGQLPSVGSTTNDPWGVPYGYCAWDHAMVGGATMGSNCAGAGLLDGEEGASGLVIAIISAGPDRTFGITCNAQPAADYLTRGANGADDIVVDMTYAEANEASGGLWHIKSGNPDQITTGKELDVQQGAQFSSGNVDFTGSTITGSSAYDSGASLDLSAGGLFMLPDQTVLPDTDCDDPGDIPANSGLLRRYTGGAGEVLQICDGIADPMNPAWTDIGGSGGAVAAAGNNTEVQFNAGGVLSASPNFVWTGTTLDITGAGDFSTDLNVGDELVVGGIADLNGALDVAGNTNLGGTLDVSGVTDINNQLNVTGAADFGDTFNADGAATFGNTLAVTGNASFTAQVLGSAGSAAQPSYAFSSSSSTGIYYTSSGMGFSIGGTNEMTLSSAGLEVNNLTVVNNISADRFLSDMSTTSAALPGFQTEPGTGIFSPVDNSLSLVTGGSTRLIIDGTGDVGIGVAVPEATLDVGGEIKVGTSAVPCAVSIHGAIRYVSGDLLQVCSSMTNDWEDIGTSGGGGGGAASYWTRISVADPRLYYTDDFVGVGTNDPLATFHVNGDFLNTGSYTGTASVPVSGAGTRMFFDHESAAFRMGLVSGNRWDNANLGDYSVAMGFDTQASGDGSVALGIYTQASGLGAMAFGNNVDATAVNSMALGLGAPTGVNPIVSGQRSFGIYMGDQSGVDLQATNTMALLGGRMIIDQTPAVNPAVSGTLSLDVEGGVGAVQYCDEDGTNCFTAASVATGGVGAPGLNREVIFNSGGVLGTDTGFVFTSAGRMGIGTNNPLAPLDVRGTGILSVNTAGRSLVFATGTGDGSNFSGLLAGDQATGRTWGFVHSQALANHLSIGYENGLGGYLPSIIASPTGRVLFGSSGTIHGGLQVDIDGPVGATQYCDNFGLNCFTPDDIVNAELAYGADGTIQFASGGALWGSANYMWNDGTSTLAVTGNATISGTLDLTGNGAMVMPRGATADRPAGVDGMIRYNSQTGHFEGYQAGQWQDILTGSALAANPDRGIQFNSGGNFAADVNLVYSSQGALMVSGTHTGTGAPPATGAGTRMFFDPSKSAFRAGAVNAGQWDNADIGEYSAAFGLNTRATNSYSTAFGLAATASGITSFATGFGAQASGDASFAMGNLSQAAGTQSFAAGLWAYAGGDTSMALGNYARATGIGGISLGRHVTVGNDALASGFGDGSMAIGLIDDAVTITTASQVRGIQSMGIFMGDQDGLVMTADNTMGLFGGNMVIDPRVPASQLAARSVLDLGAATDSIVMPSGTTAQRPGAPVEGMIRYNAERSRFEGYQAGQWQDILTGSALAAAPERGIQFNSGGNFAADVDFIYTSQGALILTGWHTGGAQTPATLSGPYMVFDPNSGAFRAGGVYGGQWDSANIGSYSFATGMGSLASQQGTISMGFNTQATNSNAVAIGNGAVASGDTSVALGEATASGNRAFSVQGGNATSEYAIAMGYGVTASGDYAMGIGLGVPSLGNPVVSGTNSLGIFMRDQSTRTLSASNTMGLFGGRMVIDPRPLASNLSADTAFEVEGTMKMAYGGEACDAAREGAIHYNSSDNNFYVCKSAGLWDVLATGTPAAAAPDRGIQFNSGGNFTADAGFVYTSSGSVGIGTASPIALLEANRDQNAYTVLGVTNYTDGAGAAAVLGAISATSEIGLVAHPDNYWATHLADRASLFAPSASSLSGRVTSGLNLIAEDAAADMRFYTGGFATTNERMRISSVGDVTLNGTGAIKLHSGTTAQRPGTAIDGMIRYNSESGKFEGYQAGAWQDILTSAVAGGAAAPVDAVQFNSGGNFAGSAQFVYNETDGLRVGWGTEPSYYDATITLFENASGASLRWGPTHVDSSTIAGYLGYNGGLEQVLFTANNASAIFGRYGSTDLVVNKDTGFVGIGGLLAPDATLDVNGIAKIAYNGELCDAAREGAIHYNSSDNNFYVCKTSGAWDVLATGTPSAAAPDRGIQFNSGGSFTADSRFIYQSTGDFIVGSTQKDDTTLAADDARMFFDKAKGSFRVGTVDGSQWNDVNVGTNSMATGYNMRAIGNYSFAAGHTSTAAGTGSFVLGNNGSYAGGYNSIVIGRGVQTGDGTAETAPLGNGTRAMAIGLGEAGGANRRVTGRNSLGIFMGDISPGLDLSATNTMGLFGGSMIIDPREPASNLIADTAFEVEGTMKMAYGGESCDADREGAIHYNSSDNNFYVCKTSGAWDVLATGTPSAAAPDRGIQFNSGGSFTANSNFVYSSQGAFMVSGTHTGTATLPVEGAGTRMFFDPSSSAFRAGTVDDAQWNFSSSGNYSFATGYNTVASGEGSVALGMWADASGGRDVAIGDSVQSSGYASVAMGAFTQATSNTAIAIGNFSNATADFSIALGASNNASGQSSVAIGTGLESTGESSLTLGQQVLASGDRAFGFGMGTPSATKPEVAGDQSLGIFMGDQDALVMSAANTMGLFGGAMVIDPNVPSTNLSADTAFEVEGTMKMAYGGESCDANREGAIHYNSSDNNFYVCKTSGAWDVLATGTPNAAAPDRGIQFNSGGSFVASSDLVYTSTGQLGLGTDAPIRKFDIVTDDSYDAVVRFHNTNSTGVSGFEVLDAAGGFKGNIGQFNFTYDGLDEPFAIAANDNDIAFITGDTGSVAGTVKMMINAASGDVGIGTIAPQAQLDVAGTGAVLITRGTTAQRPAAPVNGMIRYNSENGKFEGYQAGSWQDIVTGAATSTFLSLTDTPATYAGSTGYFVKVNPTDDGLIFSSSLVNIVGGIPAPTGLMLDDIDDVVAPSPSTGNALVWNGTAWVPGNVAVSAAAPDRGIQFNSGGEFGADANFVFSSVGNVGIGTATPQVTLDVNGETRIGSTNVGCDMNIRGSLRFDSGNSRLEICDGAAWVGVVQNQPSAVLTISPSANNSMNVAYDGVNSPTLGSTYDFTVRNIGNINTDSLTMSLTGDTGNFDVTADTCTGNVLTPSATCTITVQPKASGNVIYRGVLMVPHHNAPTAALEGEGTGFGCAAGVQGGGGVYVTCGAYNLVAVEAGCADDPSEPACSGGADSVVRAWGSYGVNRSNTSSTVNGPQNTVNLQMYADTDGAGSHPAAEYCMTLEKNGFDDWYLPARDEVTSMCNVKASIGGMTGGATYWTSTQADGGRGFYINSSDCSNGYNTKNDTRRIRCVRRETQSLPAPQYDTTADRVFYDPVMTTASTRVNSATKAVTGITTTVSVSLSNDTSGGATFKINGGAEVTSGTVVNGDTIQLVMTAPGSSGNHNTVDMTIGTGSPIRWKVAVPNETGTRRAFIAPTGTYGDFGGVGNADNVCQSTASGAGLGGNWKAIVSDRTSTIDYAGNRIDYNWDTVVNMNGDTVATSWADLWDGTITNPINRTVNNTIVTSNYVWTGTGSTGIPHESGGNNDCDSWSNLYGYARAGTTSTAGWVSNATQYCWNSGYVYCFEDTPSGTGDTTPVAFTIDPMTYQTTAGNRLNSPVITISGIDTSITVGVTAPSGNPKVKINGGAEVDNGSVSNGDTVQFVMTAPTTDGQRNKMTITAGTYTTYWYVAAADTAATKRAFVTSTTYNGNLLGVAGADAKCQARADAASLGGTWTAMIGDRGSVDSYAINRTSVNWGTLVNMNNETVATSWTDLWDGNVSNPINRDEFNVVTNQSVWTGSTTNGRPHDPSSSFNNDCYGWTGNGSGYENGRFGSSGSTSSTFVTSGTSQCNSSYRLYCVETTNYTPGAPSVGLDKQILFNNAGTMSGDNDLTWDNFNKDLTVGGSLIFTSSTTHVTLPRGSTADRPSSPVDGMIRYNSENGKFEGYQAGSWQDIVTGAATGTFAGLTDTPASYAAEAGKFVRVNSTEDGVEFTDQVIESVSGQPLPTAMVLDDLGDVTIAAPTTGQTLSFNGTAWVNSSSGLASAGGSNTQVQFNSGGALAGSAGFAWDNTLGRLMISTTDSVVLPAGSTAQRPSSPTNGMIRYNSENGKFEGYQAGSWQDIVTGAATGTFAGLTDTPASYAGSANMYVRVNTAEDGLEFTDSLVPTVTGEPAPVAFDLAELGDVALGTLSDGQILYYSNGAWVNGPVASTGSIGGLDDLDDVVVNYSSANMFMGQGNGDNLTTGYSNTSLGNNALAAVTSGFRNIAIGDGAMDSATITGQNVAIGYSALGAMTTGGYAHVAIGDGAMANMTGAVGYNIAIGAFSMGQATTGEASIGIGSSALTYNTGNYNIALGMNALNENRANQESTAIGHEAMRYADSTTTGSVSYNTALGAYALRGSTTPANNTGTRNTAIGHGAMRDNTSGIRNTALGNNALMYNSQGNYNAGLGYRALEQAGGSENTGVGANAGNTITSGSGNIMVGYNVQPANPTDSNRLNIGNTIYGDLSSDYVGIANPTPSVALDVTGDVEYTGVLTDVSDRRLKNNIVPLNDRGSMLEKINKVDTYSFTMKNDDSQQVEFGVMAQDLQTIFPELVRVDETSPENYLSVNYIGMIAPMIEATKELKAENEALKAELASLRTDREDMMAALDTLTQDVQGLKAHTGYGINKASVGLGMLMGLLVAAAGSGLIIVTTGFVRRRRPKTEV